MGLGDGAAKEGGYFGFAVADGHVEGRVLASGDGGVGAGVEKELHAREMPVPSCAGESGPGTWDRGHEVGCLWLIPALAAGNVLRKARTSAWQLPAASIKGVMLPRCHDGAGPNSAVEGMGLAPAATSACTTSSWPVLHAQCMAVSRPSSGVFTSCWPRCSMSQTAMAERRYSIAYINDVCLRRKCSRCSSTPGLRSTRRCTAARSPYWISLKMGCSRAMAVEAQKGEQRTLYADESCSLCLCMGM